MLCPKCGLDVGDSPELCDECAAQEAATVSESSPEEISESEDSKETEGSETLQSGDSEEDSVTRPTEHLEAVAGEPEDEAEAGAETETETEAEAVPPISDQQKSSSVLMQMTVMLVLLCLGVGAGAYLFLAKRSDLENALDSVVDKTSGTEESVSPTRNIQVTGSITVGDKKLSVADSLILFHPIANRLEIAFLQEPPASSLKSRLASVKSLSEIPSLRSAALFSLTFKHGSTECDSGSLTDFYVGFSGSSLGLYSAPQIDLIERPTGIEELQCDFTESREIRAVLRDQIEVENTAVSWDLFVHNRVVVVQAEGRVHFSSSSAKSTVALWNRKARTLEVGFFGAPIALSAQEKMRKKRTLLALDDNKPITVVTFDMREEANKLDRPNVIKYGVTFYRNAERGILFPGEKNYVSLFFVAGQNDSTRQLSRLRGFLEERELIEAHVRYNGKKELSGVPFVFSWDIDFDASVIDVFAEPGKRSIEKEEIVESRVERKGDYVSIRAGRAILEAKSTLAFFYPKEGDLAVGFYGSPLTPEEVSQVKKKRFLWTYVNGKRPNMVIFFNFRRDVKEASINQLLDYTVYFYRDKIGSFYFPGQYDSRNVKRLVMELEPEEIEKLSGDLREGGVVKMKMRGKHIAKRIGERFSWELSTSAPILEVK